MGWKLLAATSVALFIISGLVYWLSIASAYAVYVAPGIDAFAVSPNGEYFVIAYGEEIRLYSSSGVPEWSRTLSDSVCAVAFSPDGGRLAVFAGDRLYFLSAIDGSVVREVAMTLSCAPSSSIFWAPGGNTVLLNARGRLAYVTVDGRGELTPYVGLTITRLKWLSDAEALAIDDFGDTVYLISAAPLTVNTLVTYGERGSAGFFDGGVFVIDAGGWAALIRPDGPVYNKSLGSSVTASDVSNLGFAVVGDKLLAIDPGTGEIVWEAGLGYEPSTPDVEACGEGAAVRFPRRADGGFVTESHVFVGGEDILEGVGVPSNLFFLAWFGDCSAALVLDIARPETYIVRVDGSAEPLGGVYEPVARAGDSLIVIKYAMDNRTIKLIGPYLLVRPDGIKEPLMKLDYSTVYQINERTILVLGSHGAVIVKLGEAPPQYSWAWLAPAAAGAVLAVLAVRSFLKNRLGRGG